MYFGHSSRVMRSGRAERFACAIRVDGVRVERGRHVRRRQFHDLELLDAHVLFSKHPAQKQVIDGKAARHRDAPASELAEVLIRRIGAHHDYCARAMPERHDLERNAAVREIHHQRRQHVRGLDPARHQGLLDLRPAVVLAVLETEFGRVRAGGAVRRGAGDTRDRQCQVARHRQTAHDECIRLRLRAGTRSEGQGCRRESLQHGSARNEI
jgi:hypothetical protein